jgi:pimeloyl-ACP methyl ester carboxylesterase
MPTPRKSTNDRSVRHAALRGMFRVLARLSPGLAAEAAARLFLRVPRVPRPRGEAAAFLASGEAFSVPLEGASLAAWSWGSGPCVVLVHGWGGRASQMRAFVPPLVAAGYRVVAFDAPAHGASPGRSTSLPAFARALDAVVRATQARAAIAHSMGGAATLLALGRGLPLSRAVVLAAPSDAEKIWEGYADALGLGPVVSGEARRILEGRVGTGFRSIGAAGVGPRVEAGVLVIHDLEDREIPWESGDEIAHAVAGARLETTRGLGHRRILRDPAVLAHAVAFLEEDVSPARCENCARPLGAAGTESVCGDCLLGAELFEPARRVVA